MKINTVCCLKQFTILYQVPKVMAHKHQCHVVSKQVIILGRINSQKVRQGESEVSSYSRGVQSKQKITSQAREVLVYSN